MNNGDRARIENHRNAKEHTTILDWLNTAFRRKKNSKDVKEIDTMKKIPRLYNKG